MSEKTTDPPPELVIHDAHCHLFSPRFFETLAADPAAPPPGPANDAAVDLPDRLGWDPPSSVESLADRWVSELDRYDVGRAAVMASVPGDEDSAAAAVARHPSRLVGMFMVNPLASDARSRVQRAFGQGLRCACLFPAMHDYALDDERVRDVVDEAAAAGRAIFVHCGVLSVGVRKKLGLRSVFDVRRGNPLDLVPLAARCPEVPFIVPHFGAGYWRELLMAADLCPNVHVDTSSSNGWTKYLPGLDLGDVFRQTLDVIGPQRLLFGTDSSFFPRGWLKERYDTQRAIVDATGLSSDERMAIFGGNFDRLFGPAGD